VTKRIEIVTKRIEIEPAQHRRSCRRCGWSGIYLTAKVADRRKREHNCERQRVCACGKPKTPVSQRCAACARAELDAKVDRTPKPCLHKFADHQHGSHACYTLDGCRCVPCAEANAVYETRRQRLHAYGRWDGWVDADVVRDHIATLMAAGMSGKRIMAEAGISAGTWTKLIYGVQGRPKSKRTRRDVAERILALEPSIADGRYVSVLGASRRLQSLVALGWSQSQIAQRLGMLPGNITALVHGRGKVTYRRHRAVVELYDELSMVLPPQNDKWERVAASRARRYAKANGWLPPLAWDDDRLDDPTYRPVSRPKPDPDSDHVDHAVVERFLTSGKRPRHLTHAEAAEAYRRLRRAGKSTTEIENTYGLKPERYAQEGKGA
jgi:hypothetical protein